MKEGARPIMVVDGLWNNEAMVRATRFGTVMLEFLREFRRRKRFDPFDEDVPPEAPSRGDGRSIETPEPDRRETIDDSAWTEVLEFGDVQGAYLAAIHSATAPDSPRTSGRALRRIRILGLVDAHTWAWVGAEGTWGLLAKDSEPCGQWDITAGDTITALIESLPWVHRVETVAPHTLQRVKSAESAGAPPVDRLQPVGYGNEVSQPLGWKARLQPGDVVHADIPYSPHDPVDRNGNLSKLRRAIFIKWGHDHAVVRGVYTASKKKYVNRNGGIVLRNANQVFDKPRVAVYPRNVEIDPGEIRKKIGALDETDRGRVGIGGQGWVAGHPPASVLAEPAETKPHKKPPPPTAVTQQLAPGGRVHEHPLPPNQLAYVMDTLKHWEDHPPSDWATVFEDILTDISEGSLSTSLHRHGVALTEFGSIVHALAAEYPQLGPKPHPMRPAVEETLSAIGDSLELCLRVHDGVHVITQTRGQRPIPREDDTITQSDVPELQDVIPTDEIAAVLYDQTWVYGQLRGQYRLDLNRISQHVVGSAYVPSYVIGPDLYGVDHFHRAAERLGWTVIPTASRADEIAAAVKLAATLPPGAFAVISNAADLVPAVEDTGRAVVLFSDLSPYITSPNH